MVFTARTVDGCVISAFDFKSSIEIRRQHPMLFSPYPDCDVKVFSRGGDRTSLHFFHQTQVKTSYLHHGESAEHMQGKKFIAESLRTSSIHVGCEVICEHPIILPSGRKRIIDVAVLINGCPVEAHEVQLSPQTQNEFNQRCDDYESVGIAAYWYIGGNAEIQHQDEWVAKRYGRSHRIKFRSTNIPEQVAGCVY